MIREEQARAGTEKWIRDFVIRQGLCPFAFQSQYKIVPWCGDEQLFAQEFIGDVFQKEITLLLEKIKAKEDEDLFVPLPSTLFVLPNVASLQDPGLFRYLHSRLCDPESQNYPPVMCGAHHLLEGSEAPIVEQIFHPDMDDSIATHNPKLQEELEGEDISAIKYSLRSPWPTMQLIASSDIKEAWGQDDSISRKILLRNAKTLSSIGSKELHEKLESYRDIVHTVT